MPFNHLVIVLQHWKWEFCEMVQNTFHHVWEAKEGLAVKTIHLVCVVRPDWAWWHHGGSQTAGVSEINHMCIVPCILPRHPKEMKCENTNVVVSMTCLCCPSFCWWVAALLVFLSFSHSLTLTLFPPLFSWWCGS